MATSYGALCNDFYVNHKLALKMDMPSDRETVLHFFEQIRKVMPDMDRFRRFEGELALESARQDDCYRWIALRRTSLRAGMVNPDTMRDVRRFHRMLLEVSPFHLTVSALDVDYLELMFGFDLECDTDQDDVVQRALLDGSPLGELLNMKDAKSLDVQPTLGLSLSEKGDRQAYFEVKTRHRSRRGSSKPFREEPISVYLTIRQYGPVDSLEQLHKQFDDVFQDAEALVADRLIPHMLQPISRLITSDRST